MFFKKDWEKWDDLTKEWEKLTNAFYLRRDKRSVSGLLKFLDDIDELASKYKKKLPNDYLVQLNWLLDQIDQFGKRIIREGTQSDLLWSLQNYVAQLNSLLYSIINWFHYGTKAPKMLQRQYTQYTYAQQQYQQYQQQYPQQYYPQPTATYSTAPYYAQPYYSPTYSAYPSSPTYYTQNYYYGSSGRLTDLLALYALMNMFSRPRYGTVPHRRSQLPSSVPTTTGGAHIDPRAFYNAVATLRQGIISNSKQLQATLGPQKFQEVQRHVDELFNLANQGVRTGRVPTEQIGQITQKLSTLESSLKPALKQVYPLFAASLNSISSAINSILRRAQATGRLSNADYYQLQNLYGQLTSAVHALPPSIAKEIDPQLLNRAQNWISQYGNVLSKLRGNVGRPLPRDVLTSMQQVTNEIHTFSSRYINQLEPQLRRVFQQASQMSFKTGKFVNPLSPGTLRLPSIGGGKLPPVSLPTLPKGMPPVQMPKLPKLPTPSAGPVPPVKLPQVKIPRIQPPPGRIPPVKMPPVKMPPVKLPKMDLGKGLGSIARSNIRMDNAVVELGKALGKLLSGKK